MVQRGRSLLATVVDGSQVGHRWWGHGRRGVTRVTVDGGSREVEVLVRPQCIHRQTVGSFIDQNNPAVLMSHVISRLDP